MKRIFALVLAVLMIAAVFAGCSKDTDTKGTDSAATADNAEAGTIKIGAIGPATGGASSYGLAVKNGAQLAVDEINAAGGINGVKIDYRFEDDVHDAEKSVNAYNTLKDWGMQVLLGTVTTAPCLAVAAEAAVDNMFLLTPSASSPDVVVEDNAFQICFTDPNQGKASADYIADNGVAKKIAVIYDSSDVYSTGIYESFAAEADVKGLEIVSAEAFTADSKTDFSVQIAKAQKGKAELVFLPIYYTEASLILQQAKSAGFAPKFFGCDGLDGILGIEGFDTSLAEDVMLLSPFAANAEDELTKSFVAAYTEKFNETPTQFAADAYDGIYIIKKALESKEFTADMSASELCEIIKSAMTEITVDGVTGEGMTWAATGEVDKQPKAMVIKNGEYSAM